MKRLAYLILLPLLAACSSSPSVLELSDWSYSNPTHVPSHASVPGFIHLDLMADSLIQDPYYATNEATARAVASQPWVYTTTINSRSLPNADTLYLVFEGLAGVATVQVSNGDTRTLGTADNMFVRHVFPLADIDRSQPLEVSVHFSPLDDSARQAAYGITLPDSRAFTRIAPYQQGWDWGPTLPTCGIWQPAYIMAHRPTESTAVAPQGSTPQIELRQVDDSIGRSFTFFRDGQPIFIKGANWIPAHSFPIDDSAMRARYRLLLTSAAEAGFNMLRVWGGGIYEHDYFYHLCDSLGLMVWQDFNFSTMLYPTDSASLASIDREARQQVRRIAQHPCVVLWCGNNEVKNGWEDWGWQSVYNWTPVQRAALQHSIDTIFGYSPTDNRSNTSILARAVHDCDPLRRPYITTTPLYGWGHPECTTHGDSHYWGVWWGELPFELYAEKTGRFMSEYGFQSYPMISSILQFCPDSDLYITSPTLLAHQKHPRGRQIIDKAMQQYYGFDSRSLPLADYTYVSQLLQAWGVGYGILCHRLSPRCSGTLFWQLNDCWPVASWSSIDYYGNWKALHYRAQALFADQLDTAHWRAYYSIYPKQRSYPDPRYTLATSWQSDGSLVVTIKAETDLYDLYIDTEPHINGHFSANFIDLKAGQKLRTRFIPADPAADVSNVALRVRTLNELYVYPHH